MIDPRAKLAAKGGCVSFVGRRRFCIILIASSAQKTIGINLAPVKILRQREVERSLQETIAIRLITKSFGSREIIALRAGHCRTKGIIDTIFAAPLQRAGYITAPWVRYTCCHASAERALATRSALLGDNVDDAAHRIGTVLRGMRAFGDLDTIN